MLRTWIPIIHHMYDHLYIYTLRVHFESEPELSNRSRVGAHITYHSTLLPHKFHVSLDDHRPHHFTVASMSNLTGGIMQTCVHCAQHSSEYICLRTENNASLPYLHGEFGQIAFAIHSQQNCVHQRACQYARCNALT